MGRTREEEEKGKGKGMRSRKGVISYMYTNTLAVALTTVLLVCTKLTVLEACVLGLGGGWRR